MFRNRSTRTLASLLLTVSLALTALAGPAVILGAQPSADHTATAVPGAVTPGANVAFDVHFKNTSPSNLAQFFLNAVTPDGATLVEVESASRPECDWSSGDLHCTFGAVNSGAEVDLRVVYTTPSTKGTFTVPFKFSTTGVAPDKGKNSHGDDYPTPGAATLDDSRDFAGAYTSDGGQVVTDSQDLHRTRNPQFTLVIAPANAIAVTVGEAAFACPAEAGTCFGQWSVISVDSGTVYPGGFKVVLGYKGNIGNAKFVHVLDDGTVQLIEDECSADPPPIAETDPGCFIITNAGGESFVTLWISQNGRVSGY
ncbi:MAG: hypothetical protein WED86_01185 [Chloroflexota bacterium]